MESGVPFPVCGGPPAGSGAGDCRGAVLSDRASSPHRAWDEGARCHLPDHDGGAMTELLYLHDSYLREFDATVEAQSGQAVSLDRTSFYVGGGGQPADAGMLQWTGGECRVAEGRRAADGVWHAVEGPPPPVGTPLHGVVDWERRDGHNRRHSPPPLLVRAGYQEVHPLVDRR